MTETEYVALRDAYRSLKTEARRLHDERDAIEVCSSPEWIAMHRRCNAAYSEAKVLRNRLARDPSTRYRDWSDIGDKECMRYGLI